MRRPFVPSHRSVDTALSNVALVESVEASVVAVLAMCPPLAPAASGFQGHTVLLQLLQELVMLSP
jgi:hypothetical protein